MRPVQPSLVSRLWTYATERFPLPAYLPMILLAAFAAIGYSRVARGAAGFGSGPVYATTALTLLAAFFTLRVADEHKDAAVDRLTRPELPVPRGLVTLAELRAAAAVLVAAAVAANALVAPRLLLTLALAGVWLTLMTREFFVREWLRARPAAYLLSHMVIMPLLMLHATAADWLVAGASMPRAAWLFIAASYATGLVLEIGRKIRAPEDERPGVDTYTATWGAPNAVTVWLLALALSLTLVAMASVVVGAEWARTAAPLMGLAAALPVRRFAGRAAPRGAGRFVEAASAGWTLAAYALLALPWVERVAR